MRLLCFQRPALTRFRGAGWHTHTCARALTQAGKLDAELEVTLIAAVREAMDDKRFEVFRLDPPHNLLEGRYVVSVALPLGLMTIAKRLEGCYYRTALAFKSDVDLLVSNCEQFNGSGPISDMARALQQQLLACLPAHTVVLPPPPLFPSPPPLAELPPIPLPPRGARTPETRRRGR